MSHHLVELRDVTFVYPDGTPGLEAVNLRVTHGEAVALVGPNGAGKSTLLAHLVGFLEPTRGEVRVGDIPLTPKTLAQVRRTVGYLTQDPDDQLFMSTVGEDVAFAPRCQGLPEPDVERRVRQALETVGAVHLHDRPPYRLSVGEKRRVALAAVLAGGPDILALDEPSAGLDPRARRQCIALLKAFDHTRIIATHDLDLALEVCARTVILMDGRILADGPTGELMRDTQLMESAGLELPLSLKFEARTSKSE